MRLVKLRDDLRPCDITLSRVLGLDRDSLYYVKESIELSSSTLLNLLGSCFNKDGELVPSFKQYNNVSDKLVCSVNQEYHQKMTDSLTEDESRIDLNRTPEIESMLEEIEAIDRKIDVLRNQKSAIQRKIQDKICDLPMIYGRCIKKLVCYHQSDFHNTSDTTTIEVGDVLQFFRYPNRDSITFYPSGGEYFYVPCSKEHFEFFSTHDYVETVSFDRD